MSMGLRTYLMFHTWYILNLWMWMTNNNNIPTVFCYINNYKILYLFSGSLSHFIHSKVNLYFVKLGNISPKRIPNMIKTYWLPLTIYVLSTFGVLVYVLTMVNFILVSKAVFETKISLYWIWILDCFWNPCPVNITYNIQDETQTLYL